MDTWSYFVSCFPIFTRDPIQKIYYISAVYFPNIIIVGIFFRIFE